MQDYSQQYLRDRFDPKVRAELAELHTVSALSKSDRATVELDQQSIGRVSRIDSLQVQAMAQAAEARRLARIRQLEFTLARLQDEEFGYCVECGEFIGIARLDIDPAALRCVGCAR
ncbi:MAG: molecular chaperone DnaK [Alphaproteobacteria bacterium HGW-Alphaproteobacteria-18]|nr:MAG: molecular chaperone DnaK [Alphaproteobacteria bacterium HGW-Alphaproteobacteria-18]